MSLSKKHFEELAQILGENFASEDLIIKMSTFCKQHNKNFNAYKFVSTVTRIQNELTKQATENLKCYVSTGIVKDKEFFLNK